MIKSHIKRHLYSLYTGKALLGNKTHRNLHLVRNATLIPEHTFQAQITPDLTLTNFDHSFHYDDNTMYTSKTTTTTTIKNKQLNKANKKHVMSQMLENRKTQYLNLSTYSSVRLLGFISEI